MQHPAGMSDGDWDEAADQFYGGVPVKGQAVVFSTGKDNWQTPDDLFAELDAEFRFVLDVAATKDSAKCFAYFGPDSATPGWIDAAKLRRKA